MELINLIQDNIKSIINNINDINYLKYKTLQYIS